MITIDYNDEINQFASKDGFDKHWIKCVTFSRKRLLRSLQQSQKISNYIKKIPPAFSSGFVLPGLSDDIDWLYHKELPIGVIIVDYDFCNIFTSDEIRFILAHEYSHIKMNHSPLNAMGYIGDIVINDFIKSIKDEFWKNLLYYMYKMIGTIIKINFRKNCELEADKHASSLIENKEIARGTIKKLADVYCEGNVNCPSHIIIEDNDVIPIVTFKERLEVI